MVIEKEKYILKNERNTNRLALRTNVQGLHTLLSSDCANINLCTAHTMRLCQMQKSAKHSITKAKLTQHLLHQN